jgi:hypothetical protein
MLGLSAISELAICEDLSHAPLIPDVIVEFSARANACQFDSRGALVVFDSRGNMFQVEAR